MINKNHFKKNFGENYSHVYFRSSENMKELKDKSVQLIITSPPYYNLKEYSTKPKKQKGQLPNSPKKSKNSYNDYIDEMKVIFAECSRVLKDDGVLFLNLDVIKYKTKDKNIVPLPFDFINLCSELGLGCKDIMIYKKLFGVPFQFGKKLKNRHEYLLILSKSNDYKWNLDDIREEYPENYVYKAGHKRRNKIGPAPSSVWEFYPPSQSKTVHYHYCPFPDGLVDRAIKLYSDENDIVLDPFLGSGKVVSRAINLKRNGVGYELNKHFYPIIKEMIKNGTYKSKTSKIDKNQQKLFD